MTDHLHPDCPDTARLGPNREESLLRARAARVEHDNGTRDRLWSGGFTRRRALAGAGMAGVAALGAQLVTTRVSFGAPGPGTLVVVFLRGGMDGLSVLVPADDPVLRAARPKTAVSGSLPLARGFGLHPALEPLKKHWDAGRFTAVPALSTPDISRSHFQAQDVLERGGAAGSGWLDRVLAEMGPGTTFRAVGEASTLPRSLVGTSGAVALRGIDGFRLAGWEGAHERTTAALATLYTGLDHPLAAQAATTLGALRTAGTIATTAYQSTAQYPDGAFGKSLADVARLIKSGTGLRVACVDLGGWDMHTDLATDMTRNLTELGRALDAFATDLGPALDTTTLLTMTEFGRRIAENGSAGTDHGHGSVALLLGGGLRPRTIAGAWDGLAENVQDHGDVPGSNDHRDLLGELVTRRLGLTEANLAKVFPGHDYRRLGALT
ncbi:DUF1501 domain-containing protein [Actinokineospora sp. PR83]|uniref:DUF1501 domain-containing protein n=1 Tax=Actinokineospora sp. PR83 TaxID=2884908 RepID=UPI0027E182E4|nr:DUF1501 domain-containing protein [Actinokineospora sp. PR83]MCG8920642.1 DUF1501 domain-containing protein [Actinokineospora sp. PR83]